MAEQPRSVWAEARITGEGVSITLYSESGGDRPVVEDEVWLTQSEIESQSPSGIFSLHLSSDTQSAMGGMGGLQVDEESVDKRQQEAIEAFEEGIESWIAGLEEADNEEAPEAWEVEASETEETVAYSVPEVGEYMADDNPPEWSEKVHDGEALVLITEVTDDTAKEHAFSQPEGKLFNSNTVANANVSEPEDAPVVKGRYYRDGEGFSDKTYSFPVTRLSDPEGPVPIAPELVCPECDKLHVREKDGGLACSECGALLTSLV